MWLASLNGVQIAYIFPKEMKRPQFETHQPEAWPHFKTAQTLVYKQVNSKAALDFPCLKQGSYEEHTGLIDDFMFFLQLLIAINLPT